MSASVRSDTAPTCAVGCLDPTALNYNPSAAISGECVTAVPGCMDAAAANYYPAANVAIPSSCVFPGCTDTEAANFNPSATISDGSCLPQLPGCTNAHALNYQPYYTVDDGSCVIVGCTDMRLGGALFNPAATFGLRCMCLRTGCGAPPTRRMLQSVAATPCCPIPEASNADPSCADPCVSSGFGCCDFAAYGCIDSRALNFVAAATAQRPEDACILPLPGCTVPIGTLNFDSRATINEGCIYAFRGCTDSAASNFVPLANVDDGTCRFDVFGCADAYASNYDSAATIDDGSCVATPPPSPPSPPPRPPPRPPPHPPSAPLASGVSEDLASASDADGPSGIFIIIGVVVSGLALLLGYCLMWHARQRRSMAAAGIRMLHEDGSSGFGGRSCSSHRPEYTGKAADEVIVSKHDSSCSVSHDHGHGKSYMSAVI